MNKLFTFILDYEGGTYISQIRENQLDKAFEKWLGSIDFSEIDIENSGLLINDVDTNLTPLDGITNVWCTNFFVGEEFALVNIVETVG